METYLKAALAHPALADLQAWYSQNVPGLIPEETATDAVEQGDKRGG